MRRFTWAIALVGAIAVAGCGGAGSTSSSSGGGEKKGIEGTQYTLSVRGERMVRASGNPAMWDPANGTTFIVPDGGLVTSPSGIDCGFIGTTVAIHTKCEAQITYGTLEPLTATTAGTSNIVWAWAGACSGLAPCSVTMDSDKLVAIRFATEMKGIGSHPNFSDGLVHGAEFAAGRQWPCKDCHGDQLQGAGLAIGCIACHTTQQVAAFNAYYDSTPVAPTGPVETCASCHPSSGTTHALSEKLGVDVTITADPTYDNTDIRFSFNVKVNGANRDDFTLKAAVVANHNEDQFWVWYAPSTAVDRAKLSPTGNYVITPQGGGSGNYTITLTGLATAKTGTYKIPATTPGTAFMVSTQNANGAVATAVAYMGGAFGKDVVSDQACKSCHANFVWGEAAHDVTHPIGVAPCYTCHARVGAEDPRLPKWGSGLMGIVHGIHNSEAMAAGMNVDIDPSPASTVKNANAAGTYTFTWASNGNKFNFSIGFPSYMLNCENCHDSPARLAAVKAAPVTWSTCMSCHNDWNGFPDTQVGGADAFHRSFNVATGCSSCHDGSIASTVSDFHNGLLTVRAGLIWDGQDVSVVEGAKFDVQVAGVAWEPSSTTTYIVSWTAKYDGAAVNPCNLDFAVGPVFLSTVANAATGQAVHNMSIIREYAVGNDWVIGKSASSPGQPGSVTLVTASQFDSKSKPYTVAQNGFTECSGNTALTHLKAETSLSGATRGVIGLQGKPAIRWTPAIGTATEITQARAKSPVYEFSPSTLAASTTLRRAITDTAKCLKCHQGSLYQHGGNRVDNVELCVICHNPASSEEQNRVAYGVTPAEAYDGKIGQTYDLRTMLHAVHSAGETGKLLVYYRSNGVYAFGSAASIATIPNWKTTPKVTCSGLVEGRPSPVEQYMLFGSIVNGTVQVPAADGITPDAYATLDPSHPCTTVSVASVAAKGYPQGTYRTFNEIPVEYPRPLNDCSACHVAGFKLVTLPDPKQAVAVSDSDIGSTSNVANLLDDVLTGASAQSCFTCHQASDPQVDAALKQHGYGYGWTPQAFPGGRQDIINAAP
jgi:OmcA/MtrC family decaheme c-type cytochrome